MRLSTSTLALVLCVALEPVLTHAGQIEVTLFQQKCTLTGPPNEETLKLIHSISPEKLQIPMSEAESNKSAEDLKKLTGTPPALDHYRELALKYLEAQSFYAATLPTLSAKGKPAANQAGFLKKVKLKFPAKDWSKLALALKKAVKPTSPLSGDDGEEDLVQDSFFETLGGFPQEEFHRVIKQLGVQYNCVYE